jgi:hypothetical protein
MRLSVPATFAIAALALGVTACGGGDDKLSKADLGKKANAICKDFDKKIAAVPQPTGARNVGTAAAYYDQTRPIVNDLIAKLDKLEPEDSIKKDWTTFVDKQNEAARLLTELIKQIKDRDEAAQQTLSKINAAVETGSAAARRAGATACAPSTSPAS